MATRQRGTGDKASKAAKAERERAGGAPAQGGRESHIYSVECDVKDLHEFYHKQDAIITRADNLAIARKCIFANGLDHGGIESWPEAEAMLRGGHLQGAERAKTLADSIMHKLPAPESAKRRPLWGQEGDEVCRERLIGGADEYWRTTSKVTRRAPRVIRIAANWGMNAGQSAENIAWNGAAITALVDVLERADYGTEINLVLVSRHGMWGTSECDAHTTMGTVRVKAAGDNLNLPELAAVAGHAGIFRSYGFAMILSSDKRVSESLGSASSYLQGDWDKAYAAGVVEAMDMFIDQSTDEESAKRSIEKALREVFPDMEAAEEAA